MRNGLNVCTSIVLYRELCQIFELHVSPYLTNLNNRKHRNSMEKFRLSSHQLFIDTGRHTCVDRHSRKCFYVQKMILKTSFTSFLFSRSIKNYAHSLSIDITTLTLVCSSLYNYLMQMEILQNVCQCLSLKPSKLEL